MSTISPHDRRPIGARQWASSRALAHWLAQRRITPNAISIAGLAAGVSAGAALACTSFFASWQHICWSLASVLIGFRLLANMLDGMVAEASGKASSIGALFNEVPDRISDAAILIGLGFACGGAPTLGFVAALTAIFTAYVRAIGVAAGATQQFCGPMAKQQRMAIVVVVALVSAIAPLWWLPNAGLALIAAGSVVTAIRRLSRQISQLRGRAT
jgi:phosphatidylglycerophosphate synthase